MTPYYADPWLTVYHGDARAVLAELPAESVHCVVTSPPYWGLRDYGTAAWEGGDEGCDHLDPNARDPKDRKASTLGGGVATIAAQDAGSRARETCRKCGARRIDSQLGLEPTPEQYVENMVAVFREVRRVLRSDGTVWLNLGDSYAMGKPKGWAEDKMNDLGWEAASSKLRAPGLKPKDLVGIPWRVAFALQADGWYLRSDIIWSKPNPMPESVTDRPTKSHEYLFLLSKSARYYYDADAVREAESPNTASFVKMKERYRGERHEAIAKAALERKQDEVNDRRTTAGFYGPQKSTGFRNLRSVWSIATAPYPGAHFATFPPKLVEPCIKAGTSEKGVCPECGAPWVREVERRPGDKAATLNPSRAALGHDAIERPRSSHQPGWRRLEPEVVTTTGWRPSCAHTNNPVTPQDEGPGRFCQTGNRSLAYPIPATVLDPFAGSGTTGMVAQSLSRRAILIDLSMDYLGQLLDRNRDIPLGLGA